MRSLATLTLATLGLCAALSANDGAALYKKCAACHGAAGEKSALGKSKIIKDLGKEAFVAAMKGYQDGSYGGASKALMVGQVKNLTPEQIDAIAAFIVK